jgi:energy-coupling factor transport system substrate-specific component
LVAVGAVCRIALGQLALGAPVPLYGVLIKVGLAETLAFVSGFVFGPVLGFLSGAMIIVISDLFMMPGPWTPFIAAIIGILGVGGGVIRRLGGNPSVAMLGASAAVLTILSEFLQNAWFAFFFNIPIVAALAMAIPSMVTAVVNNVILLTTVGLKTIGLIQRATTATCQRP